ncbi:hypothetical protein OG607_23750 [Streptomyces sp. NBC_01537]|uniref:TRADD-N-associated membrane domain-containing protein n=1 Tax=Streptomyces sp. NBC_01537 TaxID=2903896 RepID=UPI00386E2919
MVKQPQGQAWTGLLDQDLLAGASFLGETEVESRAATQAERTERLSIAGALVSLVVVVAGVVTVGLGAPRFSGSWRTSAAYAFLLLIATVQAVAMVYGIRGARQRAKESRARAEADRVEQTKRLERLEAITPLATLINVNDDLIRKYHNIATFQADRSFKSSQRAMWSGMGIIMACAIAGIYADAGDTKAFVALLGGVGATLSGFLSRTYLAMHRDALRQMNKYFEQPVLRGYYLTAERLVRDLQDSPEGEMKRLIAERVLAASDRLLQVDTPEPRTGDAKPLPSDAEEFNEET